ncbi:trypsin-like peptidase domain-containing protein [Streptomyces sp. J2-1]|uniref:trypsin-like serine peptidase n=1 Tax=Streptomyces corallincola TaxID=2851888 RepID=UPI001C38F266|nr:trypsin-like peptidase domain-containing protein [Streptomyces corallincola]MBV2356805.1 trypsin-like peptidase domain-containing protein [Streptomyces corallincola]
MKRIPRPRPAARPALACAVLMLAVTSASVASAADTSGPLGVTGRAAPTPASARVGALFDAGRAHSLKGGHFCTASVVHSPRADLIVTAAHCVGEGSGGLLFVPGYHDGKAPYGVWTVGRRYVSARWTRAEDEDSDLAFARVDRLKGRRIEDVVGANRFATGTATGATAVTVTGYPDTRESAIRCTNRPSEHSDTQQRIDCPSFTSGTSGSPWVNGDHRVVGVLGGHEKGGSTADVSYSVVLGAEAAGLYRKATAGS